MKLPCESCKDILKPMCFQKETIKCKKLSNYIISDDEHDFDKDENGTSVQKTKRILKLESYFNKKIFCYNISGLIIWNHFINSIVFE